MRNMKIDEKLLKNGMLLILAKQKFLSERTRENYWLLLNVLRDCKVIVPVTVQMCEEDKEQMLNSHKGDVITTEGLLRFKPDMLTDSKNKLYFPVFSCESEMPEDYRGRISKINLPMTECVAMAYRDEKLSGIVLDPFTESVILPPELGKLILTIPSRLEAAQEEPEAGPKKAADSPDKSGISEARLLDAHRYSSNHKPELEKDKKCRCFYCLEIFEPAKIKKWVQADNSCDRRGTAVCPYCGMDAVIGESSGYPITKAFLLAMKKRFFKHSVEKQ